MQYMIIERFKGGDSTAVGERFQRCGRMMPDGAGLSYISSWMATDGSCCYQLMDAPNRAALDGWIAKWSDLVDFDVVPVSTSAEFWAARTVRNTQH